MLSNKPDEELYKKYNLIPSEELEYGPVCGQGTFGQIRIARWNGTIVATKSFHYKQNFHAEIRHFPQDKHPNIIKLFGICPKHSLLVLEYADIGSLYHILHERLDVRYNISHAINWCLQAASGISYLHSIKPKPMMHRDLKPPNLLVFDEGRVIKLCDFGTLRMVDTEVTDQRGSAAWMAPEVFQTKSYTEKCDIYSWAIILWEVLSRKKPYDDITETFRIFWLVSSGLRPPLLQDCPQDLERLMVRCWDKESSVRPDIFTVEREMFLFYDRYVDKSDPFALTLMIPDSSPTSSVASNPLPVSSLSTDVLNISLPLPIDVSRSNDSNAITPKPSPMMPEVVLTPSQYEDNYYPDIHNLIDDDDFEALLSADLLPVKPDELNSTSMQLYELHREEARNYLDKYFNIIVLEDNLKERQRQQQPTGPSPSPSTCTYSHSLENLKSRLNSEKEKFTKLVLEKKILMKKAKEKSQLQKYALDEGWVMIN